MLLKLLSGLCLFVTAVIAWVVLRLRWELSDTRRVEQQLAPTLTDREIAQHRPHSEGELRALALGPNEARILQLYRRGWLARGVVLEYAMDETRTGPNTKSVTFFTRYAWRDELGRLQERRSDLPSDGLLNASFDPLRRDATFVVAYEPNTKEHVVFFQDGGVRIAAPPPPAPVVVPPPAEVALSAPPPSLEALGDLLRTAPAQLDDPFALQVIADRLGELDAARGEFMSLQLARASGELPSAREQALLADHASRWLPTGVEARRARFSRGFLVEARLNELTDPAHPAWLTVERLWLESFAKGPRVLFLTPGRLPRLSALRGVQGPALSMVLTAVGPQLEELHFSRLDVLALDGALDQLAGLPRLQSLELQLLEGAPVSQALAAVLRQPLPALRTLWLPEPTATFAVLRAAAERAPADLSVRVAFNLADLGDFGSRATNLVWLQFSHAGVELHVRGRGDRNALQRARAFLAAAGIDDPRVYTSPAGTL